MATSTLSEAIELFLVHIAVHNQPNTVKHKRSNLEALLISIGNIQTRSVGPHHFDVHFMRRQGAGICRATLNNELFTYRRFFAWCVLSKHISQFSNPTAHLRPFPVAAKHRLRVPRERFGDLLNNTDDARDRMVVALGLYLFLRQSEMLPLRLHDVNLVDNTMSIVIPKTGQVDTMPICAELHTELMRWLRVYSEDQGVAVGELPDDALLLPARQHQRWTNGAGGRFVLSENFTTVFRPDAPITNISRVVHFTLERTGFLTRTQDGSAKGKTNSEGIHTLRRSGARALYDTLVDTGYDGALRMVQAMLHHATATTTERYIGMDLDRKRRDETIKGKMMYPPTPITHDPDTNNVVHLANRKQAI